MMMLFRRSTMDDIDEMVRIAEAGRAFLKQQGINQWQRGTYPDRNLFVQDVKDGIGYVVTIDEKVAAICAVTFTDEESYRHLLKGKWLSEDDALYATVHRTAVAPEYRGRHTAGFLFAEAEKLAKDNHAVSVRLDTHAENVIMQKALHNSGYTACGEFRILDGDEAGDMRVGFEKLI